MKHMLKHKWFRSAGTLAIIWSLFSTVCLTSPTGNTPLWAGRLIVNAEEDSGSTDFATQAEERKSETISSNEIPNWPDGPEIGAEGAILMEASTGTILYEKNIHEKLYPASTTKILTCLLAAESCENINDMVKFSNEAVFSVPVDGSSMGIDVGQSITVEQCLYGIMVGSANEVANALAEYTAGSVSAFADMMNTKAKELGCTDSHFVNPNGLFSEDHYTSAYDLATIARDFFNNELLSRIANTPRYHFTPTSTQPDDFYLLNKHKLITQEIPYEGIIGGKTGYTDEARETLVTCAEQNGMRLICVIMKEESPNQFYDTTALFDYGFQNFQMVNVADHETHYVIDNESFFSSSQDIFGNSKPILSLNSKDRILLPNTITFDEVESSLSYDDLDTTQAAKIAYSYQGIPLGTASVNYNVNISDTGSGNDSTSEEENIIFINVKNIILWTLGISIAICFLLFLQSLFNSYYFSRRRSIWKGRLDSKKRHRKFK
ncbi:MAG: D-alanyl-D-alanine carboxypeptidase [Lachnospiraceae bacterium]|nr:D-alanyl-D-alanine carboxypeptidase [Lachnospiraceae bacterium]